LSKSEQRRASSLPTSFISNNSKLGLYELPTPRNA
jgi:hypothetical protein